MLHALRTTLFAALACAAFVPRLAADEARTAAVTVAADPDAKPIPPDFIGFSYEKTALPAPIFTPANTALVALFKGLGPGVVRIAGAKVDACRWDAAGADPSPQAVSPKDVERLAGFLRACDWKVIYGINFADNTPERAAAEAKAAARILKDRLLGFEIGNEPNLYDRGHRPKGYGYKQFLPEWNAFADAVAKAVPDAALTGPSTSTYGLKDALSMAHDAKDRLAMLTSHYYIGKGKDDPAATIEKMLAFPDKHLEQVLDAMREATAKNKLRMAFRLDEANSFHSGGKKGVSDTFASALWSAETLFVCAERGAGGVNFHIAGGAPYTPILHDWKAMGIREIRPEFHGIRFFALAAHGTPMKVETKAGHAALRAHAVLAANGVVHVALINPDPKHACHATVEFPAALRRAECVALTGPALEAKKDVLLAGAPIGTDGSWHPRAAHPLACAGRTLKVTVPPACALMVKAVVEEKAEEKAKAKP